MYTPTLDRMDLVKRSSGESCLGLMRSQQSGYPYSMCLLHEFAEARLCSAFENYFLQAQRVRMLVKADFDRVFCVPNALDSTSGSSRETGGVHVLIHPSAIRTAPPLPDPAGMNPQEPSSTLDAYVQDVMTVPASLAGLPALSVPGGNGVDGWPIGVSIVGQWGSDELVMRVGEVIESVGGNTS